MEPRNIPDYNLFMMCCAPRREAFAPLPAGFYFDLCRREELEIWKRFPFDTEEEERQGEAYMARFFANVYAAQEEEFFSRCLFVRAESGAPVGTAFLWRAYGRVNTLQWVKVRKEYEGQGIGRALAPRICSCRSRRRNIPCICTRSRRATGPSSCTRISAFPCSRAGASASAKTSWRRACPFCGK